LFTKSGAAGFADLGEYSLVSVTLDQSSPSCVLRLEGEVGLSSASELKQLLLEALASGKDVRVDLESAAELGVTTLQLLSVAEREAKAAGLAFIGVGPLREGLSAALRDAGFDGLPIPMEAKEG
jgi:anti-anti-sigma regulatory factor